jgi:hypothetical protein
MKEAIHCTFAVCRLLGENQGDFLPNCRPPGEVRNAGRLSQPPRRLSFSGLEQRHIRPPWVTVFQECFPNGAKRLRHALNPHFSHLTEDVFSDGPSSLASTELLKLLVGQKEHVGALALKASTSVIWRTHVVGPIVL